MRASDPEPTSASPVDPDRGEDSATARDNGAEGSPRRGGRPTRIEAERLAERILEVATGLFLAQGYGPTSVESVAQQAGISKRTFYARYPDKAALFAAVVGRIVDRLRPPGNVPLVAGTTLDESLRHIGRLIVHAAVSPPAIALHRMIVAESGRFPELARVVAERGGSAEAVTLIAGLLAHSPGGGAGLSPEFAAEQFLFMMATVPQRRAMGLGQPIEADQLDTWVADTVALFLRGWRANRD